MIRRQVVVPAGAGELWRAVTEPEEAGEWLGGDLEWSVEVGAGISFTPHDRADGARRFGRVDEVDPGRHLRFTWWPAEGEEGPTEVTWTLEPGGDGGTLLTVEEAPLTWTATDTAAVTAWAGEPVACVAGPA